MNTITTSQVTEQIAVPAVAVEISLEVLAQVGGGADGSNMY